jgi:hypothetical protein
MCPCHDLWPHDWVPQIQRERESMGEGGVNGRNTHLALVGPNLTQHTKQAEGVDGIYRIIALLLLPHSRSRREVRACLPSQILLRAFLCSGFVLSDALGVEQQAKETDGAATYRACEHITESVTPSVF